MTLPPADLRNREFRNILLIKLSAVGDVVHTLPVLNKLRRRYPNARVDWLTSTAIAELLRHNSAITNVIEFARDEWSRPWRIAPFANYVRLVAGLRAVGYDLVLDLHGQLRTAVFALATGAPVRIGFDRPRASVWNASSRKFPVTARKHAWQGAREGSWIVYTHHIPVPTLEVHAVDRYLNIGPLLDLDRGDPDFSFPIPQAAHLRVASLLRRHAMAEADLVIIAPGTIWETKHWGSRKFSAVAQHFLQRGYAVALTGSRRERDVCDEVARLAPGAANLAGETSLSDLAALTRRASICVANDSGPMHLAVALKRPVVTIFGPTDPIWVGPYRQAEAVVRANLPCSPCYLRRLSRCSHGHACMDAVPVRAVIERMEDALRRGRAGGGPLAAAQASAR